MCWWRVGFHHRREFNINHLYVLLKPGTIDVTFIMFGFAEMNNRSPKISCR